MGWLPWRCAFGLTWLRAWDEAVVLVLVGLGVERRGVGCCGVGKVMM